MEKNNDTEGFTEEKVISNFIEGYKEVDESPIKNGDTEG